MMIPDYKDFLEHSAKGTTWKIHKYISKIDGRYYYPEGKHKGGGHSFEDPVKYKQRHEFYNNVKEKALDTAYEFGENVRRTHERTTGQRTSGGHSFSKDSSYPIVAAKTVSVTRNGSEVYINRQSTTSLAAKQKAEIKRKEEYNKKVLKEKEELEKKIKEEEKRRYEEAQKKKKEKEVQASKKKASAQMAINRVIGKK